MRYSIGILVLVVFIIFLIAFTEGVEINGQHYGLHIEKGHGVVVEIIHG